MTHQLGWKSWAAGAVVLVAVTACTNDEPDAAPPQSPSPSATSSPTASPSTPSDRAAAEARDLAERYFAAIDAVRADSSSPISRLNAVAAGTELAAQTNLIRGERKDGQQQTGLTKVVSSTVQSVNLDNSDPAVGKVPMVVIDVCWDVSNVDIIDKAGKSVVSPDRADRGWARLSVANHKWSTAPSIGWRVVASQDLEKTPCTGS